MSAIKQSKRKAVIKLASALLLVSMLITLVAPVVAQSYQAVAFSPFLECVKWDDEGVCIQWQLRD